MPRFVGFVVNGISVWCCSELLNNHWLWENIRKPQFIEKIAQYRYIVVFFWNFSGIIATSYSFPFVWVDFSGQHAFFLFESKQLIATGLVSIWNFNRRKAPGRPKLRFLDQPFYRDTCGGWSVIGVEFDGSIFVVRMSCGRTSEFGGCVPESATSSLSIFGLTRQKQKEQSQVSKVKHEHL